VSRRECVVYFCRIVRARRPRHSGTCVGGGGGVGVRNTYEPTGRARAGRDVAGAAENVPVAYTRGDRGHAEIPGHYILYDDV